MSTPIAADILNDLATEGVSVANVMEEVLWLHFEGVDISREAGQAVYLRMSRAGRNIALNRRTRRLICAYVARTTEVVVTNVECAEYTRLDLEKSVI